MANEIKQSEPQKIDPFEEILKNNPLPEETKIFLDMLKELSVYEEKIKVEAQTQALANIDKFREATKMYLDAVSNILLPQCYVETLTKYIDALQRLRREQFMGLCSTCSFKVGMVKPFYNKPAEQAQDQTPEQKNAPPTPAAAGPLEGLQNIEAPAAEEDKKINLYNPEEPEKTATQIVATETGSAVKLSDVAMTLDRAKGIAANHFAPLENFDAAWTEYVSFLKNTEPNLELLTDDSIASDFMKFTLKKQP